MGKPHDHKPEVSTARQFYADVSPVRNAREVCEDSDAAGDLMRDEAAEKLRLAGCSASQAPRYVELVLGTLKARDLKACEEEEQPTSAPPRGLAPGMSWMAAEDGARRLIQALSQIWAWPDSRKGLGALFFAMGAPLYGCNSMRELAKLRAVSVEDVSNVVEELQRILGLPRTLQQKGESAVKSYKRTNGARSRKTDDTK
jgi:hypothetical protein